MGAEAAGTAEYGFGGEEGQSVAQQPQLTRVA